MSRSIGDHAVKEVGVIATPEVRIVHVRESCELLRLEPCLALFVLVINFSASTCQQSVR